MCLRPIRQTCANCNQALPRAATIRCPRCRELVAPAEIAVDISCRLCKRPLPRAHAGQCPTCAVAARRGADRAAFGRRRQ